MKKVVHHRLRALTAAVTTLSMIVAGCASMHVNGPIVHRAQDWPMAGRTAAGAYSDTTQQLGPQPAVLWEFDMSGGTGHGGAIVVDSMLVCGNLNGEVSIIDMVTGKETGSKKLSNPISASPLSIGNELYVCLEAGKASIVDYNLRGGEFIWKKNIGGITASPIAAGGSIITGTLEGMLFALRPSDGETMWKFKCDAPVYSTPCSADSIVYCADTRGSVFALQGSSGALLWKRTFTGPVYGGLSTVHGIVYVPCRDNHLYALDARTGATMWNYDAGDRIMAEASTTDTLVVVGALNGDVAALSHDGRLYWKFSARSAVNTPAIILHDILIVTSLDTYAYALRLSDGSVVWKHSIESRIKTIPIIWNGSLLLFGDDKTVYRLGIK